MFIFFHTPNRYSDNLSCDPDEVDKIEEELFAVWNEEGYEGSGKPLA